MFYCAIKFLYIGPTYDSLGSTSIEECLSLTSQPTFGFGEITVKVKKFQITKLRLVEKF